jgi:hypothetical protein
LEKFAATNLFSSQALKGKNVPRHHREFRIQCCTGERRKSWDRQNIHTKFGTGKIFIQNKKNISHWHAIAQVTLRQAGLHGQSREHTLRPNEHVDSIKALAANLLSLSSTDGMSIVHNGVILTDDQVSIYLRKA